MYCFESTLNFWGIIFTRTLDFSAEIMMLRNHFQKLVQVSMTRNVASLSVKRGPLLHNRQFAVSSCYFQDKQEPPAALIHIFVLWHVLHCNEQSIIHPWYFSWKSFDKFTGIYYLQLPFLDSADTNRISTIKRPLSDYSSNRFLVKKSEKP